MDVNEVSGSVVDAAMKVHTALGPGLLESAYEACLLHELRKRGRKVLSQVALPVVYDGVKIDVGYRIDLLVEDVVIVELKAVEKVIADSRGSASLLPEAWRLQARLAHQLQRPAPEGRHQAQGKQSMNSPRVYHRGRTAMTRRGQECFLPQRTQSYAEGKRAWTPVRKSLRSSASSAVR